MAKLYKNIYALLFVVNTITYGARAQVPLGSCSLSCNQNEASFEAGFKASQGPQGKRGPIGPKGSSGPKGDAGPIGLKGEPCDCSAELDFSARRINALTEQVSKLSGQITELKARMNKVAPVAQKPQPGWCEGRGGIQYLGTCLWGERKESITLDQAQRLCAANGAVLPEFRTKDQFNTVLNYQRSVSAFSHAWTSMTKSSWSNEAYLYDGQVAPYVKLRTDSGTYRTAPRSWTAIYLLSRPNAYSADQGMGARAPSESAGDVVVLLCHKTN